MPIGPYACGGIVITFGDKRVYVAGETEDVPEVKSQKQIDVAFLPINNTAVGANEGGAAGLRTMTPAMFTNTVKTMHPKIVFPYAYGNNDPKKLSALSQDDKQIEVRVRDLK